MAFLYCEVEVINPAICWNGFTPMWKLVSTLYSKNLTSNTLSAGNELSTVVILPMHDLSIMLAVATPISASETTRGKSFNFDAFKCASGKTHITND